MQQSSPPRHPIGYGQSPQTIQQIQPFLTSMQQQGFNQKQLGMANRMANTQQGGPSTGRAMNMQSNGSLRQNPQQVAGDDQNDPLFMLTDSSGRPPR